MRANFLPAALRVVLLVLWDLAMRMPFNSCTCAAPLVTVLVEHMS